MRDGYKKTELGEIPVEWEVKKFDEVVEKIVGGGTPSRKIEEYYKGKIPWATVKDMGNSFYKDDTIEHITNEAIKTSATNLIDEGNIIVATRMGLGRGFINQVPMAINQDLKAIYPKMQMNTKFLMFWYLYNGNLIESMGKGSTVKGIRLEELKALMIAVPPIKEQKKISNILSTIDSQINQTDKLIKKTKELKKGLMQNLLAKGIGHTKFKKTEVGEIPVEWAVKKFKDISKVSQGLQIAISDRYKEYNPGRYIYITNQYLNDKENEDNIYYLENPNESVICKEDDILMTRTGNTGMVITNVKGVFHNNFFKIDYDRKRLYKDFLYYYLNSVKIQSLIIRLAGTTTIPDLKHGDFYRIPIIIPPIEEQKQIANILSSVDEKIEQYEDKKEKLQEIKKGLMQKLLTGKIRVF